MQQEIKRDIKSIAVLLATQGMINLGEIKDPIQKTSKLNLEGARVFIDLLEVLKTKTMGNLSAEEDEFLTDILCNIKKVYEKKINKSRSQDN
jgi:hypothetical protein